MKRLRVLVPALIVSCAILVGGCGQAAPAPPAPTAPPAKATDAPAKPAEPTKGAEAAKPAATAVPAAAPAGSDFPVKGRAITLVNPYAAGGAVDISARALAPVLEKELGTPVQVVNKPGGGTQIANTEVALAKPDGYTILYTSLPAVLTSYLDTTRQAAYTRKSFETIAMTTDDSLGIVVPSSSPYKTLEELVTAAKAKPETIKLGDAGLNGVNHLAALLFQKYSETKFATVHFEGGGPLMTAILGGHVDAGSCTVSTSFGQVKSGAIRVLGISDTEENKNLPGVKTLSAQGYKVVIGTSHVAAAPAGTPKAVVDTLSQAMKRALESDELKARLDQAGLKIAYKNPAELAAFWENLEKEVQPAMEVSREK